MLIRVLEAPSTSCLDTTDRIVGCSMTWKHNAADHMPPRNASLEALRYAHTGPVKPHWCRADCAVLS